MNEVGIRYKEIQDDFYLGSCVKGCQCDTMSFFWRSGAEIRDWGKTLGYMIEPILPIAAQR